MTAHMSMDIRASAFLYGKTFSAMPTMEAGTNKTGSNIYEFDGLSIYLVVRKHIARINQLLIFLYIKHFLHLGYHMVHLSISRLSTFVWNNNVQCQWKPKLSNPVRQGILLLLM